MKPFVFDNQEYTDLDALGLAFSNQFDLALKAIQEKSFVKFIKKFKTHKTTLKQILFQSRYLQNALSIMIYLMTKDHILYIGHKRYSSIQSCLEDIFNNSAIAYFALDHGFSNTLMNTIEEEKLRLDLKAFEDHPKDSLALSYMANYYKKDSIEPIDVNIKAIQASTDSFKTALQEFKKDSVQISLAHKYGLQGVLELRKKHCPVFMGISLIQTENETYLDILENGFYLALKDFFKKAKYKGRVAKNLKKKIKSYAKSYKKYFKMSVQQKIAWHESFHTAYLEWVDYYKLGKIILKDSNDEPTIPYCDTYISPSLQNQRSFVQDSIEKPYQSILKPVYNLNQFSISFRNHSFFVYWSIFLAVLMIPAFVIFCLVQTLKEKIYTLLSDVMTLEFTVEEFTQATAIPSLIQILFYVGMGITIIFGGVILILKHVARRRYNALCRLSFYRKNELILRDKETEDYEKIVQKEAKYAKSIDRFYRFYGGILMAGLSLVITTTMLIMINTIVFFVEPSYSQNIQTLFHEKIYFIAIPPVLCLLLGFLRHKKTAWSAIFTYWISIVLSAALIVVSILL